MTPPPETALPAGVTFGASGSLVERTLARLTDGPMSTPRIAEEVLALRGNPKAAAAAVFALLGSDPRFHVDGTGTWSLTAGADAANGDRTRTPEAFADQEWAVVDVETTGGSAGHGHRVIEIAAVRVAGGRIVGEYSSLVNPGQPIPRMITSLTGITNADVSRAPRFEKIAARVAEELGGRVFVGHNAAFDWGFVRTEMERATGRTLVGRRFCTLRVARRLLPHLPSRSLGALADYFGVEMTTHHRALDDAVATARLLLRFLDDLAEKGVEDWRSYEAFLRTSRAAPRRRTARPRSVDQA